MALAVEPQAAVGENRTSYRYPPPTRTWDEIAPGHLVLARKPSTTGGGKPSSSDAPATLHVADFGNTRSCPSFVRHRRQSQLLSPPAVAVSGGGGRPRRPAKTAGPCLPHPSRAKPPPSPGPRRRTSPRTVRLGINNHNGETVTTEIKSTQTDRIRALNDALRKDFSQGHAVMTKPLLRLAGEQLRAG